MKRRDAIKSFAMMVGGTFSAPTLLAVGRWGHNTTEPDFLADFSLTDIQTQIVAEVAELIIPNTSTPGAKDAGVPPFIVMMLRDCYKTPEHVSFLDGVKNLERMKFLSLSTKEKTEILQQVESDAVEQMKVYQVQQTKMGDNDDREQMAANPKGIPFWRLMKELTMLGYFTSEKGIKSSFDYVPIPGKLEMIKMKPNQKSFAY